MHQPQSLPRPSDRWIPWYIVAFFISLALVLAPMCIIAVRTNPGVVTEQPYEKGLAYNKDIAAAEKQEQLHWRGYFTVIPAGRANVKADFTLADAAGKPLKNAAVTLWLVRPTQGGLDQKAALQPQPDGHYEAALPLPARGVWDARISATIGEENYQMTRRIVIP